MSPCPILSGVVFIATTLRYRANGMMVRVFTNGPGNLGSITGRVIPKTQKKGT